MYQIQDAHEQKHFVTPNIYPTLKHNSLHTYCNLFNSGVPSWRIRKFYDAEVKSNVCRPGWVELHHVEMVKLRLYGIRN